MGILAIDFPSCQTNEHIIITENKTDISSKEAPTWSQLCYSITEAYKYRIVPVLSWDSEIDKDFPVWHYEKNGIFSIKSAYRLAFDLSRKAHLNSGSSSTGDETRNIWKLIWKTKVPNKIRIFAWRCASDNLATKRNKWRRTLGIDSTCNIYSMGEENRFHGTVLCTKAKALRNRRRAC